jgi:hypothetical protein
MPNESVKWGRTGSQVEPPDDKLNAGSRAGFPEAAQYTNWLFDRFAAGVNFDRKENCLLYMPMYNDLSIERGVGSVTFARSTVGTYVDRYGVVQTAAIDEPRFERNGLLMEGASTNLIDRSEEIDDPSWSKIGTGTTTANTTAAPDGNTTADTIDDTDSGGTYAVNNTAAVANDSVVRTVSVFMKEGTAVKSALQIRYGGGTPVELNTDITWATHTVSNGSIEEIGGGWYRVQLSLANNNSGNTTLNIKVFAASRTDISATGTVFVWGAQGEELPFASSYIPTTTAAVTRTAESCDLTVENNIGLQANAGTVICDADILGDLSAGSQIAFAVTGETFRRIIPVSAGIILGQWGPNMVSAVAMTPGIVSRLAIRHDGSGVVDLWNGGTQIKQISGADVSDSLGSVITIGGSGGASHLFGHITNVRIYDRALSDQEMPVA